MYILDEGKCSLGDIEYDFAMEIIKLKGYDCKINPCTTKEFPRIAKRLSCSALKINSLE